MLREADGPIVVQSGVVGSSAQQFTVRVPLMPATRYTWTVLATLVTAGHRGDSAETNITSGTLHFFSAPAQWHAAPIWAPRNSSGGWPTFAFLRYGAPSAKAAVPRTISGGVLFVTANPPTGNLEQGSPRPPKVLAAYKLWVQGTLLGMGPGRGRCSPGVVCRGVRGDAEQVFDGFDVTPLLGGVSEDAVDLFATGFGVDQSSGGFASGRPKLLLELRLRFNDGTSAVVATGSPGWAAYDADAVYVVLILFTVTFCANPANDLTCPPSYIII